MLWKVKENIYLEFIVARLNQTELHSRKINNMLMENVNLKTLLSSSFVAIPYYVI